LPNKESVALFFIVTLGFSIKVSDALNVIVTVPDFAMFELEVIELNVGLAAGQPTVSN